MANKPSSEQASPKAASAASETLTNSKSSKNAKTAAGSALTQAANKDGTKKKQRAVLSVRQPFKRRQISICYNSRLSWTTCELRGLFEHETDEGDDVVACRRLGQPLDNLVLGIEGDFNGSSYKGNEDFSGFPATFIGAVDGNLEMKSDWQASVRGRLGYAFDRTLFYGTAGVASARAELSPEGEEGLTAPLAFDVSDTKTPVGYTVRLGTEHGFTDNWIGRLAGRYSDFGSNTSDLGRLGDVGCRL